MGCVGFLEVYISVLLLAYSISSAALDSPGLLLSYSTTDLASHNTIVLIITHLSTPTTTTGGTLEVEEDGILFLIFSNEHDWSGNKKVSYSVTVDCPSFSQVSARLSLS